MPEKSEFVETVLEKLSPLGEPHARYMFGGWGVYLDGVMCGLVADDALFLKVDDVSRSTFAEAGSKPFVPFKDRDTVMQYYEAPAEMFDEDDMFLDWFRLAFDAALRAAKSKGKRGRKAKSAK